MSTLDIVVQNLSVRRYNRRVPVSSREQLEQFMGLEDQFLFVGAPQKGIEKLVPHQSKTHTTSPSGEQATPIEALFATSHLEVAIFAAAVWSRDGWSGWHTYDASSPVSHEFYAAPVVLRDALLGNGGSVYLVERQPFEPYLDFPDQYFTEEPAVEPIDEYPVTIHDMRWKVVEAAWLRKLGTTRKAEGFGRADGPEIDTEKLKRIEGDPRKSRAFGGHANAPEYELHAQDFPPPKCHIVRKPYDPIRLPGHCGRNYSLSQLFGTLANGAQNQ